MNDLEYCLSVLDACRDIIRERAMIYQADLKDTVAAYYCLDRQTLYDLPYIEWVHLSDRYRADIASRAAREAV